MDDTVKNTIIAVLQVVLFLVVTDFAFIYVETEKAHKAQYEYMYNEIKEMNREMSKLHKELEINDTIVQKVLDKEW